MSPENISSWTAIKPVFGVVHIKPLPGSPGHGGNLDSVREAAFEDARKLTDGGVHGLILENFGDAPYFPDRVPAHTVAHVTAIAAEIIKRFEVPVGINILRNDGVSALAAAHASGARFIRVNVLSGVRLTDQGIVQGIAHELMRERAQLGAEHVMILADFRVKHSSALSERPLTDEVEEMIHRAGADALIATGNSTGRPPDPEELGRVRNAAVDTPVLAGSGVTSENLGILLPLADGFIVGTHFKKDGVTTHSVDTDRVKAFMELHQRLAGR